jgi:hypothetical protein
MMPNSLSGYLPNDPAGQKATGNQQGASTQREQRSAARVRERSRRSASGSAARCRSAARSGSGAATTGGNGHGGGATVANIDATEAGVDLSLGDAKLLSDLSNGLSVSSAGEVASRSVGISSGVTILTLRSGRSLNLRTVNVLDTYVPTNRLSESRGSSSQHHGQHGRQQHYLPQHYLPFRGFTFTCRIFSSPAHNVNTIQPIFYDFLKTS